MSNLSELLPTGGGQNAVDFVASGTLSSGQTVVLNSDGTVTAVASDGSPQVIGSTTVFDSDSPAGTNATFDSVNNKVVIAYSDVGNSNYGTAIVGTVSGTSISFGTAVVFQSANVLYPTTTFDSVNEKVVISYRNLGGANYGTSIVGTVSGTSISFGSSVVFESAATSWITSVFDSSAGVVVIAYMDEGNGNNGTAIVGTVSGTSISFGSPTVYESGGETTFNSAAFDSVNNKVVIAYRDAGNGSSYGTAVVGTVSGTSISFGSAVVFESAEAAYFSTVFDNVSNKIVIAYRDDGNSLRGTVIAGTVSGTSISFGSSVVFNSSNSTYISAAFDSINNKTVIVFRDEGASQYGKLVVITITGTLITTISSPVTFEAGRTDEPNIVFDGNAENFVVSYLQDTQNRGVSFVFQNEGSNVTDFIGITAGAISDTATGAVNVYGGINEAQTGLTIGSDYYVQANGSLSTTASSVKVGQAISATTINMMDLT